jgi:hypothetical protein
VRCWRGVPLLAAPTGACGAPEYACTPPPGPAPPPPHTHTPAAPAPSFRPDTGYTDLYLAGSSRAGLVRESFMERVERLAYADQQRKEAGAQARSQHHYSQVGGWRAEQRRPGTLTCAPQPPHPLHLPGALQAARPATYPGMGTALTTPPLPPCPGG